ncbi:PP2C family protein-serine/threonine phosphatase [Streptomyces sp. NPDC060194]|uniref:PP2C family protein-serine/threonine phosphatase n=1 Tax=Streptomyces sp. NPDC060194 TaxID=3347069 RepID=UPI00364D1BD7
MGTEVVSLSGLPMDTAEVLALSRTGCFVWEPDAAYLALDATALSVLDLDGTGFDGDPHAVAARVPADGIARLLRSVRDVQTGAAESMGASFPVARRDGSVRSVHALGRLVRGRGDVPDRIVGTLHDVAEEQGGAAGLDAAVRQTGAALLYARTVTEVARTVAGPETVRRFGAHGISLGIVDLGRIRLAGVVGETNARFLDSHRARLTEHWPMNDVVRSRSPRYFVSRASFLETYPQMAEDLEGTTATAAAFLPLVVRGSAIGALSLTYEGRGDFSVEERALLGRLADTVGQALRRVMLVEQTRDMAARLQSAMLPRRIPDIPLGDVAVRYRSARAGTRIGGDWYDVMLLDDHGVGFAIGDVQGHDTEAAAIMGQLRIAMNAYATDGHSPAGVLARASRFLDELQVDRFATCLYAEIDLATGMVRAASAGHPSPYVRRADGTVEPLLIANGPPLGVRTAGEARPYGSSAFTLGPGDTLLFFTDGLVERPGEDIDTGLDRLADALRSAPEELQELADHLDETMAGVREPEDDAALLVLRRRG